jgi:hypothetical protein
MKRIYVLAVLALAACSQAKETEPKLNPVDPIAISEKDKAECAAKGGAFGHGGLLPGPVCITPTPDAGKPCSKSTDCSGFCMAETKTCSKQTPQFGCFDILMEDGGKAGLCVD